MRQAQTTLDVATPGQGLVEITGEVASWTTAQGIATGLLTVFVRHTSASLVIQENADPDVRRDLETFFAALVKTDHEGVGLYRHSSEGPDDMPSHIKGALTATTLSIPVANGCAMLGTWQGIFLFEHRARAHIRHVVLHLIGD